MELLLLLSLILLLVVIVGSILGILAKQQVTRLTHEVDDLRRELNRLREEVRVPTHPEAAPAVESQPKSQPESQPGQQPEVPPEPRHESEAEPAPTPEPEPVAPPAAATPPPLPGETSPDEVRPWQPPKDLLAALHGEDAQPDTEAGERAAEPEPEPEPEPASTASEASGAYTPPPPPPSDRSEQLAGVEQTVGLRWLTWVGVAMLFLGIAFFLKYAYERDWLGRFFGPRLRLATAAGIALTMGIAGWRSLKNRMIGLGQGLLGGSQAMLYLTVYAAFQPALMVVDEPLLGPTSAFALLATVTAIGLALAVRLDAIAMAFLAVAGGLATPALISTGGDSRDALCTYLLLLDLGVLAVALWRRWRAVDLLAFVGTAVLFTGWYARWRHAHPQPDATLLWLATFHLVFVLVPFAHHLRHRTPAAVERFALALANVAWTFGCAAWMLHGPAPRLLAAACLGAAGLYAALGVAVARRVGDDARTRDGFLCLAVLLLTLGLFYLLPVDGITTGWAVEASALLWLGYRYGNLTTRWTALLVLLAAVVRTLAIHLPGADPAASLLSNRWFVTVAVTGIGVGAFAAMHRRYATTSRERNLSRWCGIAAGYWLLFVGSLELARHAGGHPDAWGPGRPEQATVIWLLIGTHAFLGWSARWPHRATLLAALLPLVAAAITTVAAYDAYPADAMLGLNGCFLCGLAVCATAAFAGVRARRDASTPAAASALFGTAQLLTTVLVTFEVAAFAQRGDAAPPPQTLAQALGWAWLLAAFAGGLAAAIWSSRRVLALASLPLAAAMVAALVGYGDTPQAFRLLANARFALAALACAATAMVRPLLLRIGPERAADPASAIALVMMLVVAIVESSTWSAATFSGPEVAANTVWMLALTFVIGAAGGYWRACATDNRALRGVAAVALAPALALPLAVYLTSYEADWMFVNRRFGLIAASVVLARTWSRQDGFGWARRMAWIVALLALTTEPPVWLMAHVEDAGEARRQALFSVTVTWVLSAALMLFVGFARDVRALRLGALALLALTAAKLLLLDMSGAQQLYRILAFVLVGITFVGASWLYHRFERRLLGNRDDG